MEITVRDKRSSLFCQSVSGEEIQCYNIKNLVSVGLVDLPSVFFLLERLFLNVLSNFLLDNSIFW
jgi:hypothetical protein